MSQRIAYFDCFSGASGDMLVGALLDAGLAFEALQEDIARLHLGAVRLTCTRQVRKGISGTKFDVLDEGHERPARNLQAIQEILGQADLPETVRQRSLQVFQRLAEAEARVHGTSVEHVHFHEVGAVDSLVDIVGFCAGLYRLEIAQVYASPLPTGGGKVRTEHGLLPVPAPATLELLAQAQAPIVPLDVQSELVTPTGAALLATLATFRQPAMRVQAVGYGFGTKEFDWPNAVRVWIGEEMAAKVPLPGEHAHPHEHSHEHEHPHAHEHGEDAHSHEHSHEHGEEPA